MKDLSTVRTSQQKIISEMGQKLQQRGTERESLKCYQLVSKDTRGELTYRTKKDHPSEQEL